MINNHYPAAVANPTEVLMVYKSSVWTDLDPVQQTENDLASKQVFASVTGLFDPNGTKLSTGPAEQPVPGTGAAREAARRPSRPGSPVPSDQYDRTGR